MAVDTEFVERRDGSFYVAGSRVPLAHLVREFQHGELPEAIRSHYTTLTLEQVYGAITFYLGSEEEVERDIAERERVEDVSFRDVMRELKLLSVVALLEDVTDRGLLRGQVGTVVERLAPGVYEIEFSDDGGRTYASLSLRTDQLLPLHHEPSHQAA